MNKNSEKIIEVKDLTVGYDGLTVLKNINFSVNKGEVFAILGGSGCGKSTMLKHMIGLYKPIKGDIIINETSIVEATDDEKLELTKHFGVLYQSGALFSSLTLEENITLPLEEFTDLPKAIISSLAKIKLSQVGLEGFEKYSPFEISGGMRKRAGLARAMALDPDILFFDEPSAGLDPISSAELDRLILHLKKTTGSTMVIVTHELDSIFTVADRVIILDKKTKGIVAEGKPKDIKNNTLNPWVKEFLTRSSLRG
jgi:phospholipid/cholesterol/gamma-HCH transport system ATP-binding protein